VDIRKLFGDNVRHYRLAAGLSQEAVAERMGVDRAYVSLIERGEQNATLLSVHEAAQALRVKPADLFADPPGGTAV
jgi:transcriptional regulator with XRE-family HTH domain